MERKHAQAACSTLGCSVLHGAVSSTQGSMENGVVSRLVLRLTKLSSFGIRKMQQALLTKSTLD